eukprot:m.404762 g.404762  ORF g.404762 m.404762 type:complete len:139 (-) comp28422_c0_seq1:23-439(-)
MDGDGLPIVGPGIDFTKVKPIQHKRTVAFLNHFITHTASFLNRFSTVCEEKLESIAFRLQRLEITASILEAKLDSIANVEAGTPEAYVSSTPVPTRYAPFKRATPAAAVRSTLVLVCVALRNSACGADLRAPRRCSES